MFEKILIANRGEIAVRIIRACREMGIATVAVYSQADEHSLHVQLADEAICIGPPPMRESYLSIYNIIMAAKITGAEAIHPGYGALSERPDFAQICAECGLKFIGPPPEAIRLMGNKSEARRLMREAGVPVVPGTENCLQNDGEAFRFVQQYGYPVIIKAAAGGGGRGMRIVQNERELEQALRTAQQEAEASFGDGSLYLEKYLEEPRHIEVQILADEHGNIVHLGERDCSIQNARHQKMLEEAPSPALRDHVRERLYAAAIKAARAVGYQNAGTVEFLYVEREQQFYFIEMNTRIQVEHPVTEMITGLDLIKEQIRLAGGEKLGYRQRDIVFRGHAIECRITAEDPYNDFRPTSGRVEYCHFPGGPGVRVDTHLYPGYEVPSFYDPLLAKIVVWGRDRSEAIARMERALEELRIEGVRTTQPFHQAILGNAFFRRGEVYTNFVQRRMVGEFKRTPPEVVYA
jgi:acetyl-CoA carboxylase biotin carboxylase subunit